LANGESIKKGRPKVEKVETVIVEPIVAETTVEVTVEKTAKVKRKK